MLDNAQAMLFFHTIFREAENAWAFVHEKNYESFTFTDEKNPTITKKYIYDTANKDITITYRAWVTNKLLLVGTIRVRFEINSYLSDGMLANIFLPDFSINGHDVRGESSIRRSSDNKYVFNFVDGSIHEQGVSMPVLITGNIDNGQYERIEGGDKFSQDDDVWAYSGTMTGMLHEEPKLTYTNKVIDENDATISGTVYFTMNCKTIEKGVSLITIPERPDIIYGYYCSEVRFISVKHVY